MWVSLNEGDDLHFCMASPLDTCGEDAPTSDPTDCAVTAALASLALAPHNTGGGAIWAAVPKRRSRLVPCPAYRFG